MKQIIKYLPLVITLSAIADTQFELLVSIGLKENVVNYIKLLGLILTAFMPSIIQKNDEMQVQSDQIGKRPKKKGELDSENDSLA